MRYLSSRGSFSNGSITITFTQNGHSVLGIPGVSHASIRTTVPIFGLLTHAPEVSRCGNQYPEHQQGRGLVYLVVNGRRTPADPQAPEHRTEARASQEQRVRGQTHP